MGSKNNQQTFRVTGYLQDGLPQLCQKFSVDLVSILYRAALRSMYLDPQHFIHEMRLGQESPDVQEIVDRLVVEQFRSGMRIDELAKPAWMTAAITEARALSSHQHDKFWVIVGNRKLGPHRLDQIRLWVGQKIAEESWLLQPEKGSQTTPIGFLPGFWDFPKEVTTELEHIRTRINAIPDSEPTKKQREKLEFFGLPYPADVRRAQASAILDVWMVLDREMEQKWQKRKG